MGEREREGKKKWVKKNRKSKKKWSLKKIGQKKRRVKKWSLKNKQEKKHQKNITFLWFKLISSINNNIKKRPAY